MILITMMRYAIMMTQFEITDRRRRRRRPKVVPRAAVDFVWQLKTHFGSFSDPGQGSWKNSIQLADNFVPYSLKKFAKQIC